MLAAAALAAPLRALAQQPQMKRIGFSFTLAQDDPQTPKYVDAFHAALAGEGWHEGVNVLIDYRWGSSVTDVAHAVAVGLIALNPNILVPVGTANAIETAKLSHTTPIIFALVSDPVGSGIVTNLSPS